MNTTVVLQIPGPDVSDDYRFEISKEGSTTGQDGHEPMGIFHDVEPGEYVASATIDGVALSPVPFTVVAGEGSKTVWIN